MLKWWFVVACVLCSVPVFAEETPVATIRDSRNVMLDLLLLPEQQIPPSLLKDAEGIAIIPHMVKAGFIVGGRYGRGVLLVRRADGSWGGPLLMRLFGGSVGWQIGAQEADVVLVFKSQRSVQGVVSGHFTLGADAAVAAGRLGRRLEGVTDLELQAEILSYSRSRGLFAGVSLVGASLDVDSEANAAYYGRSDLTSQAILTGDVGDEPLASRRLRLDLQEVLKAAAAKEELSEVPANSQ